jgi:hypothetical protein
VSTSIWIPLVTAALGLATGLGTAVFTQRQADGREDMRWKRERQERLEQWHREDSQRWLQERQQAYARLITALHEWELALEVLYRARWIHRKAQTRAEFDMTAIRSARDAADEALVSVRFIAPESLGSRAQFVVSAHSRFPLVTADITSGRQLDAEWNQVLNSTEGLREFMSKDLGLEIPPETKAPSDE